MEHLKGYKRPDGRFGVRNHVVVMSSVACANGAVQLLARRVAGVVPVTHGHGCGRAPQDAERHFKTLAGLGANPNVAAVLVVGLGCEFVKAGELAAAIAGTGKPAKHLNIQETGGTRKTVEAGAAILQEMLAAAAAVLPEPMPVSALTVGLQCGGSDALSGITANPATGLASDAIVAQGGSVILTESTEMIGTTEALRARACDADCADRVEALIARADEMAHRILGPLASYVISPGNMDGGMTTIKEKSLGCVTKAGSTPIRQVVDYAETPREKGLIVMDGPGYDMESTTGVVAGGAQVVVFTTGRGTPLGFPIAPVIKVSSNTALYERMGDDIDVDAGGAVSGEPLNDVANRILDEIAAVANGKETKSEALYPESGVCLYTTTPAF